MHSKVEERERDKERSREEKNTIKEIQRQRHRERQESERQRDGTNTRKTRARDRERAGDPETELTGAGRGGEARDRVAMWGDLLPCPHPLPQDATGAGLPRGHGRREGGGQPEEDETPQDVSVGDLGLTWGIE